MIGILPASDSDISRIVLLATLCLGPYLLLFLGQVSVKALQSVDTNSQKMVQHGIAPAALEENYGIAGEINRRDRISLV